MVEKAVFYAEYSNMNETGQSVEGLIEVSKNEPYLLNRFQREKWQRMTISVFHSPEV